MRIPRARFGSKRLVRLSVVGGVLVSVGAVVSACSSNKVSKTDESSKFSPRVVAKGKPVPKGGGYRKLGNRYRIKGVWYTPVRDTRYDRVGVASWYGDLFHGRKTANGEVYDMNALTAAHKTMELPSYAWVTNLDNNRTILVRVNDRGPYARNRIIDMSRRGAELLGFKGAGTARVRVRYAGRAPLDGNDYRERQYLAQQSWARHRYASMESARAFSTASLGGPDQQDGDATGEGLFVLAATFGVRANATRLEAQLKHVGRVETVEVGDDARPLYQVRVGPFRSAVKREMALARIIDAGAVDATITR